MHEGPEIGALAWLWMAGRCPMVLPFPFARRLSIISVVDGHIEYSSEGNHYHNQSRKASCVYVDVCPFDRIPFAIRGISRLVHKSIPIPNNDRQAGRKHAHAGAERYPPPPHPATGPASCLPARSSHGRRGGGGLSGSGRRGWRPAPLKPPEQGVDVLDEGGAVGGAAAAGARGGRGPVR